MKPIMYMLCGLPGSGKTTYAHEMEKQLGAVRFTLDEQLTSLFGADFDSDLYETYEQNTKEHILKMAEKEMQAGRSVILDFGFWKKAERDGYKDYARSWGVECILYYFDTPESVSRERLVVRNSDSQKNEPDITEDMFTFFTTEFEVPDGEGEIAPPFWTT